MEGSEATIHKVELDGQVDTSNASNRQRGVKRPAQHGLSSDDDYGDHDDDRTPRDTELSPPRGASGEATPISKNQLKKLKRQQRWEDGKEGRRQKRRDKRHQRQSRRRAANEEEIAAALIEGRDAVLNKDRRRQRPVSSTKVPLAIILDCQFEKYMLEPELVSLSSQVTRCYSDNRGARYPVHLYISSYGGVLKGRNETVLENQHLKWKGVNFCDGDFIETANEAKQAMAGSEGGEIIGLLQQSPPTPTDVNKAQSSPTAEMEAEDVDKSIVYLTADSPYTLDRLEPNTCYVVGGIIDKNREKGLCYRIAREKNVRTAKLPISEYMVLQHRHILATNHVVEIMLKWLETGDWATAFMDVIPTRKGGKLKTNGGAATEAVEGEAVDAGAEDNVQQVDMIKSEASPTAQSVKEISEVEGDNAKEGLTKNSLDEPRWSAPPLELETANEEKEKPTNDMAG
ncbi:tRNA-methyltransferase-domain-containing protein [Xylaria digitata]|nr:tRNA-methyltransferase-domain-containing protein [Xylaria digitata]